MKKSILIDVFLIFSIFLFAVSILSFVQISYVVAESNLHKIKSENDTALSPGRYATKDILALIFICLPVYFLVLKNHNSGKLFLSAKFVFLSVVTILIYYFL